MPKKSKRIRPNMSEYVIGILWGVVAMMVCTNCIRFFFPRYNYQGKGGVVMMTVMYGVARSLAKKRQAKEEKDAALAEERKRIAAMEALEAQQREAERQQMLCPACGGSGQSMAGGLCPFCGGCGTRRVELCPICGGQGVNAAGNPCPYCGGRGQYYVN